MDAWRIETLLRGIGAERVRVVSDNKVSCACPLAFWTHPKGKDNTPSMVVFTEGQHGDPIYSCQSCHDRGPLRDMLLFLWTRGRDTYHWIQVLEGEISLTKATSSERLLAMSEKADKPGWAPAPIITAPPAVQKSFDDGRPWFDFKAIVEAEAAEPLPEEQFKLYASSIPRYALERGLTVETCKAWGLGHDQSGQRLLFPIRDRKGRLMAISGRLYATRCVACNGEWKALCGTCGYPEGEHVSESDFCETFRPQRAECVKCGRPEPPKYLHSKGFKRNLILYGEQMLDKAADGRVYVVEGHLDMMLLWQFGYRPVVALLGSHPGDPQIEKLIAYWRKAIVIGDGNQAGRDMAQRVKHKVADRIPVSVVGLEEGLDPGKLVQEMPERLAELLGPLPKPIDKAVSMVQ